MKIVLVDNLLTREGGTVDDLDVQPQLGLISLAAVLEAAGHEPEIADPKLLLRIGRLRFGPSLYEEAALEILARAPDVVGFTSLGCSFLFSLKVARHLRARRPELPLLLGGPHATILHRQILERFPEFDLIVRHEAEETILPALAGLERRDWSNVPGLTWRAGGLVRETPGTPTIDDLDLLPIPAYHLVPIERLGLASLRVDAGRGCPFHCTFCSTATFFGRRYRLKSPRRLVAELDHLRDTYGIRDFTLNHDLFTVSKKKVAAFCEAVADRGYTWGVSARVDCVDDELLGVMQRAGCRGIYYGIETGSRRMQRLSEKRLDLDLVEPTLDRSERLGMKSTVSFITGYPEESQDDQDDTLDMLGACWKRDERLIDTQLHMLTPEPGTHLQQLYGARTQYDGVGSDHNSPTYSEDDVAAVRADPEVFATYYHYPTELSRARHLLAVQVHASALKAGHVFLAYALLFFEGRLSLLVRRVHEWRAACGGAEKGPFNALTLVDFVRQKFGAQHHLHSLLVYCLATRRMRRMLLRNVFEARSSDRPREAQESPGYRIVEGTLLLPRIHDCERLLTLIEGPPRARTPLDEACVGPRRSYVLVPSRLAERGAAEDAARAGGVLCRPLSDAGKSLLVAMRKESAHAALESHPRRPGIETISAAGLDELISSGVLVRA